MCIETIYLPESLECSLKQKLSNRAFNKAISEFYSPSIQYNISNNIAYYGSIPLRPFISPYGPINRNNVKIEFVPDNIFFEKSCNSIKIQLELDELKKEVNILREFKSSIDKVKELLK